MRSRLAGRALRQRGDELCKHTGIERAGIAREEATRDKHLFGECGKRGAHLRAVLRKAGSTTSNPSDT